MFADAKDRIRWGIMDMLRIEDFGMFSIRGTIKVSAMVRKYGKYPLEEQQEFVDAEMSRIGKQYPEVYDTDVRECIAEYVPGYNPYT